MRKRANQRNTVITSTRQYYENIIMKKLKLNEIKRNLSSYFHRHIPLKKVNDIRDLSFDEIFVLDSHKNII